MLSEEQIKKLLSLNESLQIQLQDANTVLAARDKEIDFLQSQITEATALRSKMDGLQDEIENFHYLLYKKEQQASGAIERETGLQQELGELAAINNNYNQLLQDFAYLSSKFADAQDRLTALNERNIELEKVAGRIGELESVLHNSKIEWEELKKQAYYAGVAKYLREFDI